MAVCSVPTVSSTTTQNYSFDYVSTGEGESGGIQGIAKSVYAANVTESSCKDCTMSYKLVDKSGADLVSTLYSIDSSNTLKVTTKVIGETILYLKGTYTEIKC